MKNIVYAILIVATSISQSAKANQEIDWGTFPVHVEAFNFRCHDSSSLSIFEFYLMPTFISRNEFRSSDPGLKLEHNFAYYFIDGYSDTCDYKRQLLEIASEQSGTIEVRILTSKASYRTYTSTSEYGVRSCFEEIKEVMKIEFPIALTVTSDNQNVKWLYFGECKDKQ
jgi:hypothetical protein